MFQINCVIKDLHYPDDSDCACSFFISKPFTLEKLREGFPFEGVYHFRVQQKDEQFSYVWLDFTENEIPVIDPVVIVQAIRIDDDDQSGDLNYLNYLKDSESFIPKERPLRKYNSSDQSNEEPSATMFGKVFSQIRSNLNMDKLNTGATSIWNLAKEKAAQLQTNIPRNRSTETKKVLTDLAIKMSTVYDSSNQEHVSLLQRLWKAILPKQTFESDSLSWKLVGFQKTDPTPDFKTTGLLALHCLINLNETYPERSKAMIEANKNSTKNNYPYAIVGVNLTLLMVDVVRPHKLQSLDLATGYWDLFEDPNAFYEVFNSLFVHIDHLWSKRKAVRADFGAIIGEVKASLVSVLKRGPKNIQEFKSISQEGGVAIAD